MRALYVGRFQPFHRGHLEILRRILREYHELIIIVGSAQHSHTLENPFTAGERIQMITETLDEERITKRIYIIPVDDIHRHAVWVKHVESLTPAFDCVFSNEPITTRLFREAGYTVKNTELLQREEWSGTEIRKMILTGQLWESSVPPAVVRVIKEIDGVARMKELAHTDTV
ncbi:MAG: nicotinamide-nucleotide adenylyltransferase [Theionarchaea archaeon]|nr:nicotinamide-nucleotide adenylyltransferase [Theionarchaea archaeon]MBU7001036.1 nicotinamide-nucleotide adenylyltransferase [Theionarchaea archaeon]MBU7020525.1 nicotinamide-nucleotide adenylyltransferase [Theionarchaea archaeon]MBU7034208.1 nicotinamide-nucleotide adenylyltransferase [Theionarchaea archaeon]MBU7039818.1 nicotinamide-nucleotide adenylyltransferase [Theionarchaea archaeon]